MVEDLPEELNFGTLCLDLACVLQVEAGTGKRLCLEIVVVGLVQGKAQAHALANVTFVTDFYRL